MSLDVAAALKEGAGRVVSRNGALFVVAFAVVSLLGNVAIDSTTIALQALSERLAADVGGPRPEPLPESATPFGLELPGSVVVFLLLLWLLSWTATSIVAVRVMASEHTNGIPDGLLSRRLTLASINEIGARIVIWTLVTIGFALLVLPGVFLAICFYFARPLIAIEDRNAIDAMAESWRLSSGRRFAILALVVGAAVIYVAIALLGGALALSAVPVVGAAVSILLGAIANVFWLAVSARAFVQLREPLERPEDPPDPDDEWNDPAGVEW